MYLDIRNLENEEQWYLRDVHYLLNHDNKRKIKELWTYLTCLLLNSLDYQKPSIFLTSGSDRHLQLEVSFHMLNLYENSFFLEHFFQVVEDPILLVFVQQVEDSTLHSFRSHQQSFIAMWQKTFFKF